MPAAPTYEDGSYATPFAVSLPEFSAPFPRVNLDYILTQEWVCNLAAFAPLALNTAHPDYAAYLLVREDAKRDLGAGKVQWTRTYAKVPATWEDSKTINFTFPGFIQLLAPSLNYREPLTKTVVARSVYEYFLCAAGEFYPTPSDIPVIPMFAPYFTSLGATAITTWLYSNDSVYVTTPSRQTYEGWVAAGTEIVVQDSAITNWMGNIFVRETLYSRAQ